MARPESHADLADYATKSTLAHFYIDEFKTNPKLLRIYSAFIEEVQKSGGTINYSEVSVPKSAALLDEQLDLAQRTWDNTAKRYAAVVLACDVRSPEKFADLNWKDHEAYGLRTWAEKEDRGVFNLIDEDDTVRANAREWAAKNDHIDWEASV